MKYMIAAFVAALLTMAWLVAEVVSKTAQITEQTAQITQQAVQIAQQVTQIAEHAARIKAISAANEALKRQLERQLADAKSAAARAKVKHKATARLQRVAVSAPVIGAAIGVYLEERDFDEWRAEHPEIQGKGAQRAAYVKEVYADTIDLLSNEYAALIEKWPKVRDWIFDRLRALLRY